MDKEEAIRLIKLAEEFEAIDEDVSEYDSDDPEEFEDNCYHDMRDLIEQFMVIGIEFNDEDDERDGYCLSPKGLIHVLKVLFKISEEDLKDGR